MHGGLVLLISKLVYVQCAINISFNAATIGKLIKYSRFIFVVVDVLFLLNVFCSSNSGTIRRFYPLLCKSSRYESQG